MVFSLSLRNHTVRFWVILLPLATWAAEPASVPAAAPNAVVAPAAAPDAAVAPVDAAAPLSVTPVGTPANVVPAQTMSADMAAATAKSIQKLYSDGKTQEALTAANQFLEQNPHNGGVFFIKAQALTKLGQVDEAIAILEALIESFPEMAAPYNNLAVLYASQGRLDDARKTLETALLVQPNYATAYENLGDLYRAMARQAYDSALKLDGTNAALKSKAEKVN